MKRPYLRGFLLVSLACLFVFAGPLEPDSARAASATANDPVGPFGVESSSLKANRSGLPRRTPCSLFNDEVTRSLCLEANRGELKFRIASYSHNSNVLWWQHISTRVIFGAVHLLVALGMYFAWVHFHRVATGKDGDAKAEPHSVELSTSGVKVSSPVLGLAILVISLAFFYLYLVHVYPIVEVGLQSGGSQGQSSRADIVK